MAMKGEDMADKMEFPKTMRKFIDNYSFKDSEEVYTNGAELVPVFRVEQALEHYEKEIRNKALDDFAEKLKSECRIHYVDCDPYFGGITDSILYKDDIERIAEQLKAGGENDNLRR